MKYQLYSIRDVKVGFNAPMTDVNDQVAMRKFANAVMTSTDVINTHAQDFDLYKIGEFDSDECIMFTLDVPQLLCNGADFLLKKVSKKNG